MCAFSLALIYCVVLSFSSVESISENPLTEEAHHPFNTQYHSQGSLGQYKYGYANAQSSKEETRSMDGTTRGSYSYIDANGILQTVAYIADAEHGFKILSQNPNMVQLDPSPDGQRLPAAENLVQGDAANGNPSQIIENVGGGGSQAQPTPTFDPLQVLRAPALVHEADKGIAGDKLDHANSLIHLFGSNLNSLPLGRPPHLVNVPIYPTLLPLDYPNVWHAPTTYPIVDYRLQNGPFYSMMGLGLGRYRQYHSQNALGQYSYGYANELSSKDEVKGSDGVTRGAYSYIDANGKLQTVSYTADATNGFRVIATNLPIGPVAATQ